MKVLVTGGMGYIGSHTVVELTKNDNEIVIVDNLVNSDIRMLDNIQKISGKTIKFYKKDVTVIQDMVSIFENHKFDAIIHFAGLKAVGESVAKPLEYYRNNLYGTITLSKLAIQYSVRHFVFSSSATVYGNNVSPLTEDMELKETTNPYGETKAMSERILIDTAKANDDFNVTLLRYFNPVGAHKSGLIGENPKGIPNNLMPYITKVAKSVLPKLNIFGDDYNTIDGTGVRDYIHVVDLAKGHVAALHHIPKDYEIYNLGTGEGTSVLQLVQAFERVNKVKIPYEIVARRSGDLAVCYADSSKAQTQLKWKATKSVEDMVKDAWNFERYNSL